jgi:hypothetical protein
MKIRAAAVIGVGVLLTACPPSEEKARLGMSDSVFVHSMIELRKVAQDTTMDALMRDSTRSMILRRYALTPEQLDAAARALSAQPARAESLWKLIDEGVEKRR